MFVYWPKDQYSGWKTNAPVAAASGRLQTPSTSLGGAGCIERVGGARHDPPLVCEGKSYERGCRGLRRSSASCCETARSSGTTRATGKLSKTRRAPFTLDPEDPRFRPVIHAVIAYSKIDRAPEGARADGRLSRWAREIDRACLPKRGERRDELPTCWLVFASGASVVEASKERDAEIGAERAGVKGRGARIVPCCGGGVALEVGRELVAAETRRDRARLHTAVIGSGALVSEVFPRGSYRKRGEDRPGPRIPRRGGSVRD